MPKIFSIGPLVFGFFSAMGSYLILREVIADHQSNRGKVIPRLLMGLSLGDMFFSLGYMLSTFASPSELTYLWGNIGNQQTCTAQGFFIFGICCRTTLLCSLVGLSCPQYSVQDRSKAPALREMGARCHFGSQH